MYVVFSFLSSLFKPLLTTVLAMEHEAP